jgi:hypothetical protein
MTEKILELKKEKNIFWTLTAILLLCVGFYMYFINTTVRNVVSRENLENESSKIALEISSNEFKYITLRNSVTLQLAYSIGFKDAENKKFISQNGGNFVSFLSKE